MNTESPVHNPHDYPCTGFPPKYMVLKNKPLSYWKAILKPICRAGRRSYFLWKYREFCEFDNIPHLRIGGKNGTQIFQYLHRLIVAQTTGLNGDGI